MLSAVSFDIKICHSLRVDILELHRLQTELDNWKADYKL